MSSRIAVFNDGVIQQLAAPADLYEEPQNAFVAQFTDENNRLLGNVVAINGTACKVELPAGHNVQALAVNIQAVSRRTLLSLPPERVKLKPAPGSLPNFFSAQVTELIYLGDHVRTRVSACGHDDFVVRLPKSDSVARVEPAAEIAFGWKTEHCRALDAP
ncbi:TOBE domain-containing protein [Bradyrhizobium sp. CW1]|uniref:TOBE domain-containing protein n=1 Tax=Bradyrhizobium sp. CW1 TaxID=2782686 RepID=UPI0023EE4450|nr:TOBE domain-containing protein [Bradyrhizobium sp. CW1]